VLQQKVTGAEALAAWRRMVQAHGEQIAAVDGTRLLVPPDPETVGSLSDAEWHRIGVGPQRRDSVRRCVTVVASLQRIAGDGDTTALDRALRSVPGVGAWTSAEVRQRVLGDPDAVSVGDFHVPGMVGWALAGEREADDARMLELLAPYAGQRFRVQQLLQWAHAGPPRRGPRLAPPPHRRW
jgi:3-methyladenine DNA glycosylase/8-oxoguanine DNA glycosylase